MNELPPPPISSHTDSELCNEAKLLSATSLQHNSERSASIAYVRLFAMLCILTCHIFQTLGNELAWWFNIGVQIFLFISGFLYGQKVYNSPLLILKKQFKKY
jgi:hypothetical protein